MFFGWLFIIGLVFWTYLQSQRIRSLREDIEALHKRLETLETPPRDETYAPPTPANETQPELLLTEIVDDEPPLEATKPTVAAPPGPAPEPDARPELVLTAAIAEEPAADAPKPPRTRDGRGFEKWLSENGLAWLGGGALAIGGVFLVAYAAQQAFFTPAMRLIAALVVGIGLIGASEWLRRGKTHPLVAALLAGAGAATLYAAAWASYGIYNYISLPSAAAALFVCAGVLLALSFLHGQALGALAIAAALIAPPLTSMPVWPEGALSLYLGAVATAGFAVSGLRRWGWAAGVALLGAYAWFALSLAEGALFRALALLGIAALGGAGIGLRAPRANEADANWRMAHAYLPSIALGASALLAVLGWNMTASGAPERLPGPALASIYLIGLGALAVRERVVRPAAFQAAVLAAALGCYAFAQNATGPLDVTQYHLWTLACAAAAALAALACAPGSGERTLTTAFGATGALAMLLLAVLTRPVWAAIDVWGPLLAGAALFALAAELVSRQVPNPQANWSVDLWAGAGAAALLIALESLAPVSIRPAAIAAAGLLFAFAHKSRGWRAAATASLAAAVLALAHAISPDFALATWGSGANTALGAGMIALAGAAHYGAGWLVRRQGARTQTADALDTAAILAWLWAGYVLLNWIAAGGQRLDAFVENALRALMLIAAGFIVLPRGGEPGRFIARWRGHALMAAGLVWAFFAAGLIYNPWWGEQPAHVTGVALLNAHLLAFAAPAALAGLAANRLYPRAAQAARAYAVAAAVFSLLWVTLELRRLFHGADMSMLGPVGLVEGNSYGLAALALACGVAMHARWREKHAGADVTGPFTRDLSRATGAVAFAGVLFAAYAMLFARNAWWGAQEPAFTNASTTGVATLALAPAAALALILAQTLPRRADNACFAAASAAALFALAFGALAIRWAHQQGAMDDRLPMLGVEGLMHAVWPLGFVAGAAMVTERFRRNAALRELVLDFEAIWSVAIWPALGFSALGLWAFFNPWRGLWPAAIPDAVHALAMLFFYLAAAHLSVRASQLSVLDRDPFIGRAAKIAAVLHVFAAITLVVRYLYHGADMATLMPQQSFETWTYSAVWAVFGAAVLGIGALRGDFILRWAGLAFLLAVTAKVFLVDMRALDGVVRAASFLGLGGVLVLVALATRRFGQAAREH